jgi:hypothetical protein
MGQNSLLYRSSTSVPSAAQARAGGMHAPEISIFTITSPRHPRPPANPTGKPRTLLATHKTDIANARDQKGSSLTAPHPLPSHLGCATIWPPHDAVATNATATAETTGSVRPWEEGAVRSMHTRRTHVTSRGTGRIGPWMVTGGGTGGGGTTRSWMSRGRGGAIIQPPSLAHTGDERGRGCLTCSMPLRPVCHYSQYAITANMPLRPIRHCGQYAIMASMPLWLICHYGQYAITANTPLWPVCHYSQYAITANMPLWPMRHVLHTVT